MKHHLRIRTLLTDAVKWNGGISVESNSTSRWQINKGAQAHIMSLL